MKSVMSHSFAQVPRAEIPRSSFDRSHGYKTTFDGGYLVPILVDEVLPGDTFTCRVTAFTRLSTPIYPVMDNMRVETFFFFVPYRLVWDNFQKFMGEQVNPGDSIDFTIPTCDAPGTTGYQNESLQCYFGIPTGIANLTHTNLIARAYNLIWNEWFRDQNLQNSVTVDVDDGPDTDTDYVLLRRNKRHDYFTSCLPWPQKGDSVDLPLGTVAPIVGIGTTDQSPTTGPVNAYETDGTGTTAESYAKYWDSAGAARLYIEEDPNNAGFPGIYADLSTATAATINQLRQAFQIQRLLERDARGGTRYIEINRAHFGVTSPDARLQRPEYLGGGSSPVNITPIGQSTATNELGGTRVLGSLAGVGTAVLNNHGFSKSFTEHGCIIGMVNVRADLTYQQGLNRMWSRSTRYDVYWPALANIGEQAVLNKEIFADNSANDDLVFGYQERYGEYRYKPSLITGKFRSNDPASLDAWHLSQEFGALPSLNGSFIEDNPPISRVVAVTTEPEFIFDSYINFRCTRPMPLFGVPGLIDHF